MIAAGLAKQVADREPSLARPTMTVSTLLGRS
jgi:hypothetical protein